MAYNNTQALSKSLPWHDIGETRWRFAFQLYDFSSTKHDPYILDEKNIELFEYSNEFNKLLLTGQLIYRDTERVLGEFFRLQHLILQVEISEQHLHKEPIITDNGEAGEETIEEKIKKPDYHLHTYIVNKLEIVRHDMPEDVLVYKFELVSTFWYALSAVCNYTNYADKEPKPITTIICELLVKAVGKERVDEMSFLSGPCASEVKIFYTTSQQDSTLTAIQYLMNRLYTESCSFDVDNHLRVIVYDERIKCFKLIKLSDDSTFLWAKDTSLQLSRFYQIQNQEIGLWELTTHPGDNDMKITSLSKVAYTKQIHDFYTRYFWDLDLVRENFVRKTIDSDKIVNLFKNPQVKDSKYQMNPATFNILHDNNQELQLKNLLRTDGYYIEETAWNNKRHLYSDMLHRICYRDGLEVSRGYRVNHQPGQVYTILRDEPSEVQQHREYVDTDNIMDENATERVVVQNKRDDNQIFGFWISYKVRHVIIIYNAKNNGSPRLAEVVSMAKYNQIVP